MSIYAKIFEIEHLFDLHETLKKTCCKVGVHFDKKKFVPHISLAKFKKTSVHEIINFISNYETSENKLSLENISIFELHLYKV